MAPLAVGLVGDWHWFDSGRTLKNVTMILLLGDGHMTCLAISALFPLITKSDLQYLQDICTVWLYKEYIILKISMREENMQEAQNVSGLLLPNQLFIT